MNTSLKDLFKSLRALVDNLNRLVTLFIEEEERDQRRRERGPGLDTPKEYK